MTQVADHIPSKHNALNSNVSDVKNKEKDGKRKKD
jgi:hypothetical protein